MLCVCDAIQQQQRLFSTSDTPTKPQRCRHRPCNKLKQSVTKWLQHWLTASVPVSVPWRSLSAQRHDRKKKKKKKTPERPPPPTPPHAFMPRLRNTTMQNHTPRAARRSRASFSRGEQRSARQAEENKGAAARARRVAVSRCRARKGPLGRPTADGGKTRMLT